VESGNSSLLKNVTCNEHFHTIEAPSEEILDEIEQSLKQNGYIK
jgi:transcriptional regulator of NAD metabolism